MYYRTYRLIVSTHGIQMRVLVSLERFWVSKKFVCSSSIRFFCGVNRGATAYFRDSYTYTRLLQQNDIDTKTLHCIHAQIITSGYEQNQFVAAKLVSQYTEHSGLNVVEDARKVFDCVRERDVLLWNVIIRCYANSGPFREATNVYDQMRGDGVLPNRYTFPFVLKACASMRDGIRGQIIHGHVVIAGLETDLFVGNALVAFYGKCCEIKFARKMFDEMTCKDIVSWNSMISGYAQNECSNEALVLLHQMLGCEGNVRVPDRATFVGILPACAHAAAIQEGMWIHGFIIKTGMEVDVALGSGLISMYGSCGLLDSAHALFNSLSEKNIIVWNAIIRSYGMHGHAEKALELFSEMVDTGIKPDGISLVCILSACSHAGLVEKGKEIFERMKKDFGVEKSDEHYACMVDLLGRAGYLDEAVEFIKTMPVKAGKDVYGALLGACRIHNNIELAEEVAERLFVLDPYNAGRYILLAKMYEDAGRWRDAADVRKRMREKRIRKPLGCSGVEVDSVMHTFGAEDEKHEMSEQIFDTLQLLKMSNEFEEEQMY